MASLTQDTSAAGFAGRLRAALVDKSQRQIARDTGVSQQAVSGYLRGERWPPVDWLVRVCATYGLEMMDLLGQGSNRSPSRAMTEMLDLADATGRAAKRETGADLEATVTRIAEAVERIAAAVVRPEAAEPEQAAVSQVAPSGALADAPAAVTAPGVANSAADYNAPALALAGLGGYS